MTAENRKVKKDKTDSIEQRLEDLGQAIVCDDSFVQNVMTLIGTRPPRQSNIRRIVMNRLTKFAAAAAIIIAVLLGLNYFSDSFGLASPAYGINEAFNLYRNARTFHIKGWTFFHKDGHAGQELRGLPFETWTDKENDLSRNWQPAGFFDSDPDQPMYFLTISDGQYIMETIHYTYAEDGTHYPMASFTKLSPFQLRRKHHKTTMSDSDRLFGIYDNPDQIAGFVKIGQEQMDGEIMDIWQGEVTAPGKTVPYKKIKIWLSPASGRIARIFMWTNREKNTVHWLPFRDTHTIEYNVSPPPDCFKTEPPPGYKYENTKETAKQVEFGEDGSGVRFYDCIGFTLSDGSIILAWHANPDAGTSQEHLFANLKPGGPLPKLPAQIIALLPYPVEGRITCMGRHLTYTQKDGKFYEWSIYVPDGQVPQRSTFEAYKIIKKYNNIEPRRFGGAPNLVADEITINSKEDFDTWVLGAMAELSDHRKAPEDISYEKVLQLTGQIRKSLTE